MKHSLRKILVLLFLSLTANASAENETVFGVGVQRVAVTGGADTASPGVSCIKLDVAVNQACPAGYIAVPKNNTDLVRAALIAKSSQSKVWAYFSVDRPTNEGHCPGLVFTPCALISLMLIE